MSEDKEIAKINEKKLKEKGKEIVEQQAKVNFETVVMQISQYLNDTGLHMMNVSTDLRKLIAEERQKAQAQKK